RTGHVPRRHDHPHARRHDGGRDLHLGSRPHVDRSAHPLPGRSMSGVLSWLAPRRGAGATAPAASAEERIAFATQFQLTWWRFRKHRLAVWSGVIVILFYLAALFADTIA